MMKSACNILKLASLELLLLNSIHPALAESAATVTAIEMVVENDNLQPFTTLTTSAQLAERVRSNLQEWQFPLDSNGPYRYRLLANLGKVSKGDTPVGFSFSSGNSDPRAVDFQKAKVLPINCRLIDTDGETVVSQRESTFSANHLANNGITAAVVDKLVDQISTACLDTLEHASLPKSTPRLRASIFKPKWMPDVRVEMMELPVADGAKTGNTLNVVDDEVKKELIIHNQGTPVILNFGHERR